MAGIPKPLERALLSEAILGTKPPELGRHDGRLVDSVLQEDEARIAGFLENRGWLVSHVEAQLLVQPSSQVRVHFVVRASPPTYIRSISLVGVSDGEQDDWDDEDDEADDAAPGEDLYSPLLEALQIQAGSPLLENTAELLRDRTLKLYCRRGYPGDRGGRPDGAYGRRSSISPHRSRRQASGLRRLDPERLPPHAARARPRSFS